MPQVILNLADLAALVGERKAGCVAQHMRMHQGQPALGPDPRQHALKSGDADRCAALGHEQKAGSGLLAARQLAQLAQLVTCDRMRRVERAFQSMHGEPLGSKVDLGPSQTHEFRDPQPVAKGHQDGEPIALAVASAAAGGLDQAVDLAGCQILSLTAREGVRSAAWGVSPKLVAILGWRATELFVK
jgi:hypothetical protein